MTVTYAVRVDEKVKEEASAVAKSYGLDLATATRAFWTQMARTRSIPLTFTNEEPNDQSLEAIRETEQIFASGTAPQFESADDLFESLGA